MRQQRNEYQRLAPGYLQKDKGLKVLYSLGIGTDAYREWLWQGIMARMPDRAGHDARLALGRDRRIIKGFDESSDNYAGRLKRWLDDWRVAGHAFSVLDQVAGYLTGHSVLMRIVTNTGVWYTRTAAGVKSILRANPTNWNWDGSTTLWSRFWLILYPPGSLWTRKTWGSFTWGTPGATFGSTMTRDQRDSIRTIVQQWKPAHAQCEYIVLAFNASDFDPTASPGSPMPDGTWANALKPGSNPAVFSRDHDALYMRAL